MKHHDGIHDYGQKEKEEDKVYDITKQVEKTNNNEKEKEKQEANNNKKKYEKIYTNKIEKKNIRK